jgi:hypothetical protein
MQPPSRVRYAPVLDALCVFLFVFVGHGRHEVTEGVGWYVTVLWPLYLGWFSVAVATNLYGRTRGTWAALLVTWLGGIAIASLFRGTFTDRPYVGIFTLVAVGFIGLTTFGWRAVAALVARALGREASPA